MAQRPADLTPLASTRHFLGAELRYLRQRAGLSLAQLARAVYAHPDLLAKVEKAHRWPSTTLVEQCDAVLDTGGILSRLHQLAASERDAINTLSGSTGRPSNIPSSPILVAKLGVRHRINAVQTESVMIEIDLDEGASAAVVDLGLARARRSGRVPDVAAALRD